MLLLLPLPRITDGFADRSRAGSLIVVERLMTVRRKKEIVFWIVGVIYSRSIPKAVQNKIVTVGNARPRRRAHRRPQRQNHVSSLLPAKTPGTLQFGCYSIYFSYPCPDNTDIPNRR